MQATTSLDRIKAEIENLPLRDQFELLSWLDELANAGWDEEIAADLEAGRLDPPLNQLAEDREAGRLREFP